MTRRYLVLTPQFNAGPFQCGANDGSPRFTALTSSL